MSHFYALNLAIAFSDSQVRSRFIMLLLILYSRLLCLKKDLKRILLINNKDLS